MEALNLSGENDEPPGSAIVEPLTDTFHRNRQQFSSSSNLSKNQDADIFPFSNTFINKNPLTFLQATPKRKNYSVDFPMSEKSQEFRMQVFPHVSTDQWNNWRWQLRNRITDILGLQRIFELSNDELDALSLHNGKLPVGVNPYYASLLDVYDKNHPLRRTVIKTIDEYNILPEEENDPLGEDVDSPVPGLVHRYPDRCLFLVTSFCSVNCRYCTRSRVVGDSNGSYRFNTLQWQAAIDYIRNHKKIRDVLISGGDPLTLSDEKLEWLLSQLRKISHVEMLRIGSKVPVVLPQRITRRLVSMLRKYHPLWMSIHFTHPEELTPEVNFAVNRLADAGIPLGSQTVLLKGINDSVETMKKLYHGLLKIRVKPYYLYQCDPVAGSSHFRTSVEKGLEIIRGLRGHTSGYAVPHFVIDAPGGGGKIPLLPNYIIGKKGSNLVLRNYQGKHFLYPDICGDFDHFSAAPSDQL